MGVWIRTKTIQLILTWGRELIAVQYRSTMGEEVVEQERGPPKWFDQSKPKRRPPYATFTLPFVYNYCKRVQIQKRG